MSIIREKINFNGNDTKVKISLSTNNEFIGYQQEIDKLTQFSTHDMVNPIVDGEKLKYKYVSTTEGTITFNFFQITTSEFISFLDAVFTLDEISTKDPKISNSFFVMDFYNTFNTYNQTKIFSTYLTKIIGRVGENLYTSKYDLFSNSCQFNKIFVPNWFINQYTGNTITGYVKFSFYDAKRGVVIPFFNVDNQSLTTPEKNYVKLILNTQTKTWSFDTPSIFGLTKTINLRQIINNEQYLQKVNNTVESFEEISIIFPSGNTFNENIRGYEIT